MQCKLSAGPAAVGAPFADNRPSHIPLPAHPFLLAGAGVELVQSAGAVVVEAACVIELPELQGRAKLADLPLFVLVEKEGI